MICIRSLWNIKNDYCIIYVFYDADMTSNLFLVIHELIA